jgi:hypothetical protein
VEVRLHGQTLVNMVRNELSGYIKEGNFITE